MDADNAVRQAWKTTSEYARCSRDELLLMLNMDMQTPDWQAKLGPFACVWAAMIKAAAKDYDTAARTGVVDGSGLRIGGSLYLRNDEDV
jgi:hypothetical protein